MATYVFYLRNHDGSAPSFEAIELGSGKGVPGRALKLLGEYPGCAYLAAWEGDRPLPKRRRAAAAAL